METAKDTIELELADHYANYVRENKQEPNVKAFNEYLTGLGVDASMKKGDLSKIRELAFNRNEDLKSMALNESYFTKEYFEKLENILKTSKKFIITTAVTGKAVKYDFFRALQNWAVSNDGQILVLPSSDAKNSSTVFKLNFDPIFKNERTWIILNKDSGNDTTLSIDETPDGYYLNKHLWLSGVKTQAKTVNPIGGWDETVTSKDCSIIVGHPRQYLRHNSSLKTKFPKAVMSTGACTVNNYTNDKANSAKKASKAKEAHQFGAIIVEISDENIFHFRQIQSIDGTQFTDLDTIYYSDGRRQLAENTTLVMGDSHAGATDMRLMKSIMSQLVAIRVIDEIVLHDLCDSRPVSPHDQDKIMTNIEKVHRDRHLLMKNFEEIVHYLNMITDYGVHVVVVASNHDEHLNRALENLPAKLKDCVNAEVLIKMSAYYITDQKGSLLKYCVENIPDCKLEHPDRITWLVTDESYERYGCELGQHGHLGSNGSRGSLAQYHKYVNNCVIGHSHTAGIMGKTFQVGATCDLDQGYNVGLSSWTRTCCLVHKDGTKQLVNFIKGEDGNYTFRNESHR